MAKPVVIDDGGSLRIRQLGDATGMPGLLPPPPCTDTVPVPFDHGRAGAFLCRLTVYYHAEDGAQHPLPAGGRKLNADDIVEINCANGQTAQITFPNAPYMLITLVSAAAPVVDEEKETDGLRYIVGWDSIQAVTVQVHGVGAPVQIYPDPTIMPPPPSIFTMVHFHYK